MRETTLLCAFVFCAYSAYSADKMDTIGVTLLRQTTTNLNGAGLTVAQVEAAAPGASPPDFEVSPGSVSQPVSLFTYYSNLGNAITYPNAVGVNSSHANRVGGIIYGTGGPIATNVAHVDNYDANYFYSSIVIPVIPKIDAKIVNQSISFGPLSATDQEDADANYDDYADAHNTLFVSAVANGGAVTAPGTSYNGIGVAAYGGASSVGPTIDNGRAKPDITAPQDATSFSTAEVTGCSLLLLQAALRGDGGADTTSASDMRTLKALLLNGAIKPNDWTRSGASPLDVRYGAGVINVFNSYQQLTGGKHAFIVNTTVAAGNPHPPTGAGGTETVLSGWDFNSVGAAIQDSINHYYFNVTNSSGNATFTATATLAWNKQQNASSINNLDLFLYNVTSGGLVAASTSAVDNVEHLFLTKLPPGRYDLQVLKHASVVPGITENYALAFEFFTMPLNIVRSNNTAVLTWPIYPTGFVLESTLSLNPPISWSTVNVSPTLFNNSNRVVVTSSSGNQFFRLRRP